MGMLFGNDSVLLETQLLRKSSGGSLHERIGSVLSGANSFMTFAPAPHLDTFGGLSRSL